MRDLGVSQIDQMPRSLIPALIVIDNHTGDILMLELIVQQNERNVFSLQFNHIFVFSKWGQQNNAVYPVPLKQKVILHLVFSDG
ncbi:hypothetical protein D1872_304790 [compost metagenome]